VHTNSEGIFPFCGKIILRRQSGIDFIRRVQKNTSSFAQQQGDDINMTFDASEMKTRIFILAKDENIRILDGDDSPES
jgi:hypothetical protein